MRKVAGYTLFWIGIGMVIGFLIPCDTISVLFIFLLLVMGYHLFLS